jgi:cysteine synthase
MINGAMSRGELKEGDLIIEATAGNTGVGLAHICRVQNLRCIFVCPSHVSEEKIQELYMLGAENVVIVDDKYPPSHPKFYEKVNHNSLFIFG